MLTTLLLVSLVGTAVASTGKVTKELEYRDISVTLDGAKLDLKDAQGNPVEPFMFDGTNYLPVRAMAETLGLDVAWDGATATVVLTSPPAAPAAPAPQEGKQTFITKSGSKYHNDSTCNGGTYWPVPFDTAVGMGLTPCDKCVH